MRVYACTERGTRHEKNGDALLVGRRVLTEGEVRLTGSFAYLAVADGEGGLPFGEFASSFVLSALAARERIDGDALREINRALLCEAREHFDGSPMATTLSGIAFTADTPVLFHIGNTRAYALRRGKYLAALTRDDTVVYRMYERGLLTKEELPHAKSKNQICACFGGGDESYFTPTVTPIIPELPLLLTSDGIHDHVDAETLEEILTAVPDRAEAARLILALAREHGSTDDATLLICDPAPSQSGQAFTK